jgi:hypothetical protein
MPAVTADTLAPAEQAALQTADASLNAEFLLSFSPPQVTLEWGGALVADRAAPLEIGSNAAALAADAATPVEIVGSAAAALSRDAMAPLAFGAGARGDAAPALEWLSLRPAGYAQIEFTASPGVSADARVPLEWSGTATSAVTGDTWLALEFGAPVLVGYAQLEWLYRQAIDAGVRFDNLGGAGADTSAPAASAAATRADQAVAAEALSGAVRDFGAALEALGMAVFIADALAPLAFERRQAADAHVPGETLRLALADAGVPLDTLARALTEIAAQLENLSIGSLAVAGDSRGNLEFSVPLVSAAGIPLQALLTAAIVADGTAPLEIGAATPAPAPAVVQVSGIRIRLLRG